MASPGTTLADHAVGRLDEYGRVCPDNEPATTAAYRDLMSLFPTGVSVVATVDGAGSPQGMTCTCLASVTLEPPTLMVCLRIGSVTLDAVRERGLFAVNLLATGSNVAALRFGSPGPDAFESVAWHASPRGLPWLVQDSFVSADCEVVGLVDVSDHSIVLGTVIDVCRREGEPLLYGLRQFAAWTDTAPSTEEPL